MAPVSDVEREGDGSRSLSREDCLCPICLEIFMEPVTLPCTHTFCKVCFLESVDKATLCCPLCRKRVAVWARQHSRTKSLVNEALWRRIQAAFPRERPQDELLEPVFCPRLSEPGALRREYEDQISKLTEEKRELEEQEQRASEELIQRLLAEEEQLQREQQQRHEEDERLARLLSRELNSVPDQSQTPEPLAAKKKLTGMDRFLFPVPRSPAHSSMSNKENILTPSDPPLRNYCGPHTDQSRPAEPHTDQSRPAEPHTDQSRPAEPHTDQSRPAEPHTDQSRPAEPHTDQSRPAEPRAVETDQSQLWDRSAEGGTKRKCQEAELQGKRSCPLGVAIEEWEAELQRRRKQEEEDRLVAVELQRELDRQQQTDRRKGTADAYPLRAARRGQTATSTGTAHRRPSSTATLNPPPHHRPPNTSSECGASTAAAFTTSTAASTTRKHSTTPPKTTAPPTPKTKRQTTLTDLFNLHS